jgi:hypothetical protein
VSNRFYRRRKTVAYGARKIVVCNVPITGVWPAIHVKDRMFFTNGGAFIVFCFCGGRKAVANEASVKIIFENVYF